MKSFRFSLDIFPSPIILIYAQTGIDDMATEKRTIGVKVKTRWFFKPALMMAMAYVWIGGSARSASNFIGKYCFDIKVMK